MITKESKLLSRPVESDTKILMENIVDLKSFKTIALMELWSWDGIQASSLVILKEDIGDKDEDEVLELISKYDLKDLLNQRPQYQEREGYVIISFGFKY